MLDRRSTLLAAAGFASLVAGPRVLVAAEYMSIDAAQRAAFPSADRFEEIALSLTAPQRQAVAAQAGPQPPHRSLRAWRATQKDALLGHVFVDEVIGREDFITYSSSIDVAGKLGPVEVLAYRESHGGEIRGAAWRDQFRGRDDLSGLRFGTDIKNIAGATLSCEHVTQGVRWILALWQVSLRAAASGAS
ncbi:MAG TPA: FMN-binding protein [Steroidobacteraceae bacterium]|nr:FMN-binding protein [Steroidobacteraceae bacterium]